VYDGKEKKKVFRCGKKVREKKKSLNFFVASSNMAAAAAAQPHVLPDASVFYGVSLRPLSAHRYLIETHPAYAQECVAYVRKLRMFRHHTLDDIILDLITEGGCNVSVAEKKECSARRARNGLDLQCVDYFTTLCFRKEDGHWYACSDESKSFITHARLNIPAVWSDMDIEFRKPSENDSFWDGHLLVGKRIPVYSGGVAAQLPGPSELAPVARELMAIAAMYSEDIKFH